MKTQLLTFAVIALLISNTFQDKVQINDDFDNYKKVHGKNYINAEEETYRRQIYAAAVAEANRHNAAPTNTYSKGINEFSDMTTEEFVSNIFLLFRI
jgi:hypothetical protein